MNFFNKKVEPRFTGDIEMKTISSSKKLGNKTRKNKSPSLLTPRPSVKLATPKSSVQTIESTKTRERGRARQVYTKRIKHSKCRGLAKTICIKKKLCIFTKGPIRKYCRKKHNKRIDF